MKRIKVFAAAAVIFALLSCSNITTKAEEAKVAGEGDMAPRKEITAEGLKAVYAADLVPGTYPVEVECSSSMFPIDRCEIDVTEEGMSATLTMGGEGYLYVFPGTASEASKADEEEWIPFVLDEDGNQTYPFPLPALDELTDLASFSRRKELWYDRTLLFHASSLPSEAFKGYEAVTAASLALEDGEYSVEVSLAGGSGRTAVESPCILTVKDQEAFAQIVWPGNQYDYMIVGEEKILNDKEGDQAVFVIPVEAFDTPVPVIVDTTALGRQTEISYTLTFHSETIQ